MTLGLLAAIAAAVVFGVAAIAQAVAARDVHVSHHVDLHLLRRLIRHRAFWLAVVLTLSGFALHLIALRSLPLFLAQSVISASVAVTALLAVRMLGNRLTTWDWLAVAAVSIGLALLASSSGPLGDEPPSDVLRAGLPAGLGLTTIAALATMRRSGTWAAATLGLLAGVAFAVVGVSARVLPGLHPGLLVRAPETYALLAAAPVAFLVYSIALQRGSVTTVSAALVVTQTAVPALVGLLLLGDTVRPDWEFWAFAGFLFAAAGSAELARYESGQASPDPEGDPAAVTPGAS